MSKILNLDLSLSLVNDNDKKSISKKITKIHNDIYRKQGVGNEFTDWLDWPTNYDKKELDRILDKVNWLKKEKVETLLVIGIGGSYLGPQSAINFIKGTLNMQDNIIFSGINMSSSHLKQIEKKLEGKKWAICIISKSGTTLEPALSFRYFKTLLENKEGDLSKNYIIAITDEKNGALKDLSIKNKYETYVVPNGIGGRFSGITPVGLFPMAFAGIDIKKVLNGTKKASKDFGSLKNNSAYEYAATRFILNSKHKKDMEIFTTYDFDLDITSEWLKQLFGESEGKENKGIMPSSVSYTRDLHSLGQIIQEGKKIFFETTIWVKEDKEKLKIENDDLNLDGLNYLNGMTLHEINKKAFDGVVDAHHNGGGIPNIIITINDKTEETLGYMWYFFFVAVTMSAYLIDVNPFDQPGVEPYKKNMFKNLKK